MCVSFNWFLVLIIKILVFELIVVDGIRVMLLSLGLIILMVVKLFGWKLMVLFKLVNNNWLVLLEVIIVFLWVIWFVVVRLILLIFSDILIGVSGSVLFLLSKWVYCVVDIWNDIFSVLGLINWVSSLFVVMWLFLIMVMLLSVLLNVV